MTRRLAILFSVLAVSAPAAQSTRAPQIDSITAAELRADLFFLASDAMQGRLTDTRENALAADWIVSRFERLGLKPGGNGGGFDHRYSLMTAALGQGNAMSIGSVGPSGGVRWELRTARSSIRIASARTPSAEGQVTFAGFGIVSPERKHDDYRDAVRGRIALVLDREPGVNDPASPFDGLVTAEAATADPEGARGAGEGRHRRDLRRGRAQPDRRDELPGAGRELLAGDAAARRALHAQERGPTRCAFPSCRFPRRPPNGSWPPAARR